MPLRGTGIIIKDAVADPSMSSIGNAVVADAAIDAAKKMGQAVVVPIMKS